MEGASLNNLNCKGLKRRFVAIVLGLVLLLALMCTVYKITTDNKLGVSRALFEEIFSNTEEQAMQMSSFSDEALFFQWMDVRYGKYFTEEGWKATLNDRIITLGVSQFQRTNLEPKEVYIQIDKKKGMEDWYIASVELQYATEMRDSFDIMFRLVRVDDKWLIDSITR